MIKEIIWNDKITFRDYELRNEGIKIGDVVEIKKHKKETKIDKIRALWYLLVKELSDNTGYSKLYWKNKFKNKSAFYEICTEPDGTKTKAFKSVADGCSCIEMSQLFTDSMSYVQDNDIIDLSKFRNRYYEITGRDIL